jgi:hypothetical protein
MKWEIIKLRTCLNIVSAVIMLAGLGSAVYLYQAAENDSSEILGYDVEGGSAYPIRPEDSRKYLRDLEVIGGKAGVVADDLRRRFAGLWQGKTLALMIAGISILASFAFFYAANHLPSRPKPDDQSEAGRNEHGKGKQTG